MDVGEAEEADPDAHARPPSVTGSPVRTDSVAARPILSASQASCDCTIGSSPVAIQWMKCSSSFAYGLFPETRSGTSSEAPLISWSESGSVLSTVSRALLPATSMEQLKGPGYPQCPSTWPMV